MVGKVIKLYYASIKKYCWVFCILIPLSIGRNFRRLGNACSSHVKVASFREAEMCL